MIRPSWLFVTVGSFLFGASVLEMFGWGMLHNAAFFLPMLAASLLLAMAVRLMRRGRMALCVVLTIAQWALTTYYTMQQGVNFAALIPAALCAGFIPYHLLMLCQEPGEEYPPTIWYIGVLVHALRLFLLRADYFAGAAQHFKLTALLYFIFVLFALNELSLSQGMAGDKRPTRLMRLRNRMRTGLMALALVIACNLESIRRAAEAAVDFFKRIIAAIIAFFLREKPAEPLVNSGGGGMDLSALADGAGETPLFWRILEYVLYVLAAVIFAALCVLLIRKLIKLLIRLAKYLWARLRRYADQVSDAYEDTVESLMDWGEMRRALFQRREKRTKTAPIDWSSLSPRESVRMRYRVLRGRAKSADAHLTARQVLLQEKAPAQAADVYERARYSSEEISREDAEKMKEWLR